MNKSELKEEIKAQISKFGHTDQDAIDYTFEVLSTIDDLVGIEDLTIGINISRDLDKIESNITLIRCKEEQDEHSAMIIYDKLVNEDLNDGILNVALISEHTIAIDCIF